MRRWLASVLEEWVVTVLLGELDLVRMSEVEVVKGEDGSREAVWRVLEGLLDYGDLYM